MIKKFCTIFLVLSLVGSVFAQEGLLKVRIDDFSGGMVTNTIADLLKPNQGASLVNVVINRPGKVFKRKGHTLFAADVGNVPFTGLSRYDPDATTSYMVAASGGNIIRALSSATNYTILNASSQQTVNLDTEFVQANDLLFILNGQNNPAWHNGASWFRAAGYPSSPPVAKVGAWLRNYLFLAGNPTDADWIYISNNLEPTVFSASDVVRVNTGDGQAIQKLFPYRLDELIVYKERSIYVLDISGSTIANWTIQPISRVIGCIAPRSVVSIGNDQWFLSSEPISVRSLVRSDFDKILLSSVSTDIQDVFDGTGSLTINKSKIDKAAAVFYDSKYIISIPTGTSTVNNTTFVFDFITNSWYRIDGWNPAAWVVFDNRLFYIDAYDGRILEVFSSTVGDYASGASVTPATPNRRIDFTYISRAIDFYTREDFKQLDALEVEFDPTGNYSATVFINLDEGGWTSVGTVSLAGNSATLPITLPAVLDNGGVARKTFQLQKYGEFKKMRVMVTQNVIAEQATLQRITIFARPRPWRRE